MALLRFESGDDTDDLGAWLHAEVLTERAARLLVVVAVEIDAVVDEADRRKAAAFLRDLLDDGLGHGHQPVDVRREGTKGRLVLG